MECRTAEKDNSSAKLKKSDGYGVRSVTTLNYEVQGLEIIIIFLSWLGNEVIKNTGASSEMIGAGYSMAESWDMDRVFGMFNMYQAGHADNSYSNKINTPSTTVSFFGRGNYSLKGRYLLTATLRADGSSKFGPNHRWGYFPAVLLHGVFLMNHSFSHWQELLII